MAHAVAPQARAAAARRFSDADADHTATATGTALGRLVVSSDHAEADQTHVAAPALAESTPLPPLHTCIAPECAITKVFDTAELLELVLGCLPTSDVLTLRRVNSKWDESTRTSPLLKLHHFVNPQWSRHPRHYRLLDLNLPGFTISSSDPVDMGRWIQLTMTRAAASQIAPNGANRSRALSVHEGLRGLTSARETAGNDSQRGQPPPDAIASQLQHESLYVIQPPIVGLQAFTVGSQPSESGPSSGPVRPSKPRVIAKIHCDTGITLGFLAEAVQRLMRGAADEDVDGTQQILFKAIVSFASPDSKPKKRDGRRSVVRL